MENKNHYVSLENVKVWEYWSPRPESHRSEEIYLNSRKTPHGRFNAV